MFALRNKIAICLVTLAAATALAGCSHNQDNAPAAGSTSSTSHASGPGISPQQQQAIQQNAARQSAAAKTAPQMGTVPRGH